MQTRLQVLNHHFESTAVSQTKPVTDVWKHLGYDKYLRPEFVIKKEAVGKFMQKIEPDVIEHVSNATFPAHIVPEI